MRPPTKPTTRTQAVLIAILFLGFGVWLFHDGLEVMRTGRPIYLAHSKHSHNVMYAPECFMWSAGMTVLGVWLLGWAAGVVKGRQDPP